MPYVNPLPEGVFKGWPETGTGLGFNYQRSSKHVHQGVDLKAPEGSSVLSITDGEVVALRTELKPADGKRVGPGRWIVVQHADNLWSWYQHLQRVNVVKGQKVKAGQVIGLSGKSMFIDLDTVPHLHFEILDKYPPGKEPTGGGIQHRLDPGLFLTSSGAIRKKVPPVVRSSGGGGLGFLLVGGLVLYFWSKKKRKAKENE